MTALAKSSAGQGKSVSPVGGLCHYQKIVMELLNDDSGGQSGEQKYRQEQLCARPVRIMRTRSRVHKYEKQCEPNEDCSSEPHSRIVVREAQVRNWNRG